MINKESRWLYISTTKLQRNYIANLKCQMSISLRNILILFTCYLYSYIYLKDEFITDVLKEAFLKTYKPSPPIFVLKFPNCSKQIS